MCLAITRRPLEGFAYALWQDYLQMQQEIVKRHNECWLKTIIRNFSDLLLWMFSTKSAYRVLLKRDLRSGASLHS